MIGYVGRFLVLLLVVPFALPASNLHAQRFASDAAKADILNEQQWAAVDEAVQRALRWLAASQQPDGSFPTRPQGQPAITSLGVTAFLSAGHTLDGGEYEGVLNRAIDFALSCQQTNGLISKLRTAPFTNTHNGSHTAYYNHGISGLMLGEAYGMASAARSERIRVAIPKAIDVLRKSQTDKRRREDRGGWQYYARFREVDSDMSVTTWQLMFLRSAKNAGFDVPESMIAESMGYVERSFNPRDGSFNYGLFGAERYVTVGAVGGGIISLAMGGKHHSEMAERAGQWLMQQPFERYNSYISQGGNYHYGLHYSSQASYQLGGECWNNLYPRVVKVLLQYQRGDGSWPAENGIAAGYGSAYSTALAVLSLTPPYQLLPIYQQ